MEIPTEKKRFPWGWVVAGCGVIIIGVLALAAVITFVALPAIRTAIAKQSPSLNPLPAPSICSTAVPNSGSGSGTSLGSLPFKFSAIQDPTALSNQSLMDQMVSSLNLNNDTDFLAPKTYKGTTTLDPSTSFTLGNGWCAKDTATLQQNLANMQFQLSINGTNIDLSQYPTLYFSDNRGYACAMTGISITPNGNLSGSYHVILTQKFLNTLDDGITSSRYPAGDVTFDFSIKFQSTPNSGGTL
jgi:hypothetical protein